MQHLLNEQKQNLRKHIRQLKNELSFEEKLRKSEVIFSILESRDYFIRSRHILAYWSLADEVQTRDFILRWLGKKQFYLPVVKGEILEIRSFVSEQMLQPGSAFGILEPQGDVLKDLSIIDLVIVPGIAFDLQMNRLGRGKAYYDKLLTGMKTFKIGVCFDFQVVDKVPSNENDIKMDDIIFA